jgi:hypothetical protein
MNHLPFDWPGAVDDDHVVAHFIGGGWDGKTYAIPRVWEWRIASLPVSKYRFINKPPDELVKYDVLVYTRIVSAGKEAIYWLTRIEKADE